MQRGDIRWFRFASPDKRRPVLILGVDRAHIGPLLAHLPAERWREVRASVLLALGFEA